MKKKQRMISIDEDIDGALSLRRELNVSAKCNEFLRHLLDMPKEELEKGISLEDLKIKIALKEAEANELKKIYKERDEKEGWQ